VLTIHLPPLRERTGDLEKLVRHSVGPDWSIDANVIPTLERYGWPGNVRQLQNAIDRAKILADDHRICLENLPPEIVGMADSYPRVEPNGEVDLFTHTRRHVLETYRRHRGNKAESARALHVSRRTLYRLLEKYGVGAACTH
jgi:transcriptional regulator of acetoin/glycerol metabolism